MKWTVASLGDFLSFEYGASLREPNRDASGQIPVAGSNGIVGYHSKALIKGPGIVVGRKGSAGKVTWFDTDFWPIDTTFYIRLKIAANVRWVFYLLQSLKLEQFSITTGVPGINRNDVYRLQVFIPPPSEQHHIVEILDQADALRRMRAEADAKGDRILPALFIKMFGDPATNPMGWEEKQLSDLDIDFRYGTSVKCDSVINGLPVLRIPNILGGEINLDVLKYGELSSEEMNRLLLEQGDLLFVRTNGNPDYVGRCAVFDLDEPYLFASYLIRARFPKNTVESRFIAAYLQTPSGRQGMLPFIRTTAGQSNISVEGLKKIPIFLPDLELQRNFVNQLDNLYKLRRQREQSKSILESIFQSLLSHAFSGELTAKWREAHMKELLVEMEEQAKALNLKDNADSQQLSLL
ncbi:restriction endonuclease subunit S [Nostoc sp. FACHB-973]|nr:restriction endonuclease subunit S [Nostoc sp. FACHB-973]